MPPAVAVALLSSLPSLFASPIPSLVASRSSPSPFPAGAASLAGQRVAARLALFDAAEGREGLLGSLVAGASVADLLFGATVAGLLVLLGLVHYFPSLFNGPGSMNRLGK